MKKTVLLLALTVNVLSLAKGSSAAELNGYIPGQFLPGTVTDIVKGEGSSSRPVPCVVWNGFVTGAAGCPRETQDVAVLPVRESKNKVAWDGYPTGSFAYWQRKP